jgi:hypothetical protein
MRGISIFAFAIGPLKRDLKQLWRCEAVTSEASSDCSRLVFCFFVKRPGRRAVPRALPPPCATSVPPKLGSLCVPMASLSFVAAARAEANTIICSCLLPAHTNERLARGTRPPDKDGWARSAAPGWAKPSLRALPHLPALLLQAPGPGRAGKVALRRTDRAPTTRVNPMATRESRLQDRSLDRARSGASDDQA